MPRPVEVALFGKRYEKEERLSVPPSATEPPPERPPLVDMVTLENWSWFEPMVEVAMTEPLALTERSVLERPEMAKLVVVADVVVEFPVTRRLPAMVEDAPFTMMPFRRPRVVEVELPYPVGVHGKVKFW
jgi:hypothetical protein